jgi:hypothetical protein
MGLVEVKSVKCSGDSSIVRLHHLPNFSNFWGKRDAG